nr:reverse transcriptase domain, reverse transcriptase zinc-binding domain protein [Tanacetum cinerariifolium]
MVTGFGQMNGIPNSLFLSQLGVPMLDERKDETVWVTRMGKETKFRIKSVWQDMCSRDPKKMLNVDLSYCWDQSIEDMTRLPNNNNIWSILTTLVYGVVVYILWQERNGRMFKKDKRDENTKAVKIAISPEIVFFFARSRS